MLASNDYFDLFDLHAILGRMLTKLRIFDF